MIGLLVVMIEDDIIIWLLVMMVGFVDDDNESVDGGFFFFFYDLWLLLMRKEKKLYEEMVMRSKESVKCGGAIKGLLWYQGESDTSDEHDAETYQRNMETLIGNVREDLGLPSLPIIQVAITSGDKKYLEKVREAQLGIKLPNVVSVDAKGLDLKEDNLHLTTGAQVQLGHMLGQAYFNHFADPHRSSDS